MYPQDSWVSIDNNNQTLAANQTATFLLTINVPAGTPDGNNYPIPLYFNAYDIYNINNPYTGPMLKPIVDNTPPVTPTVSVTSKTSTSISITFNSSDERSSEYTDINQASGVNGIKSFTLVIKDPYNNVKENKISNATDVTYYTFETLLPNTVYTTTVTATDLATNSNTSPALSAQTPPAAPLMLPVSNTSYCSTTLNWSASEGATSYDVYNSTGTITKIGTTTNTFFTFTGLSAGSTNKFYVKAVSNAGASLPSTTVTVITLAVPTPIISGSTTLCVSGSATFTVTNRPSDCSISWICSSNLSLSSASGSTATFTANASGSGSVTAKFTPTSCSVSSPSKTSYLWVGSPVISGELIGPTQLTPGYYAGYSIPAVLGASSYSWSLPSGCYYNYCWQIITGQGTRSAYVQAGGIGIGAVQCTASNTCGSSSRYLYVNVQDSHSDDPCILTLSISPNPSKGGNVVIQLIYPPDPCDEILSIGSPATLSIIDNSGNFVYRNQHPENRTDITGLNLKSGIYHVIYTKNNKRYEETMLVE